MKPKFSCSWPLFPTALVLAFTSMLNGLQAASDTWGANANTAWYTVTNWASGTAFPGLQGVAASNTDTATFTGTYTGTTPGINMATASLNLGAISIDSTRITALNIGDSSATAGVLRLYGATVNSVPNVIIRNNSVGLFTLQAAQAGTMGVVLSNATQNIVNIDGAGGVTISSIISGTGPLTKAGAGTGVLTLSGTNTYSGGSTISSGTLTFLNTNAKAASGTHAFAAGTTLGLGVATSGAFYTSADLDNAFSGSMTGNLSNVTVAPTTNVGIDTTNASFTYASSVGSSTQGLVKLGVNTLTLSGTSAYTGPTTVTNGTLSINSIKDVSGGSSAVGAPTTAANGTIAIGSIANTGTLVYNGSANNTNRVLDLAGSSGGVTLDQSSASGLLKFTSAFTASGNGGKTLTLQGSTAGTGEIAGAIVNNGTVATPTLAVAYAAAATSITLSTTVGYSIGSRITGTGITNFTTITAINTSTNAITLSTATTGAGTLGQTMTISAITSLTKAGTGTWTLSGTNTFTGTTTVSAGVLVLGSANALSGGIATTGGTGALSFNGGVLGLGSGDFTRSYSGITAGVVGQFAVLGNTGPWWAAYGADRIVNVGGAGATMSTFNGKPTNFGAADATNMVTFVNGLSMTTAPRPINVIRGTTPGGVDARLTGVFTETANARVGLVKTGNGTLALTGSSTFSGNVQVNSGIVIVNTLNNVGNNSPLGTGAGGSSFALSGGTFQYAPVAALGGAATSTDRNFALLSSSTLDASGTGAVVFNAPVGGIVSPDVTGAFTATGTDKNLTFGSLAALNNLAVGMPVTGTGIPAGATISAINGTTNSVTLTASANVTAGSGVIASFGTPTARTLTLTGTNTGANTLAGVLQDSSAAGAGVISLTKAGGGSWTLSGLNTMTGNIVVNGGTLVASVSTPNNTASATALGAATSTSRTITVNTLSTLEFDAGNVLTHNFGSSTLPTLLITGGTLTNGGAATNNALGALTLTGGTLAATVGSGSGYGSWNLNGTVTSTGTSLITSSASVPMALSADSGNSNTTTFDVQSGTLTASAALGQVKLASPDPDDRISGLTKIGTGTLILSGNNTFTGGVTLAAGTLQLGNAGALNSTVSSENAVTFGSSTTGTLALAGNSVTVANLTGSVTGPVVQNANGASVSNAILKVGNSTNASGTFAGTLQDGTGGGTLALTKAGTGTLTLTGANTYTGATTVSFGTLALLGGSLASAVTVSSGASLAFTLGSPTTSTSTFDLSAGTIKIAGTPTLPSYPLITSSAGIIGTPTLDTTIAGYTLQVSGNALNLVVSGTPYSLWATSKGLTGTTGSATDPAKSADPDGDGVNNLAEFAFNGDPLSGSNNGLHALLIQDTTGSPAGNELTYIVAVRSGATFTTVSLDQTNTTAVDGLFYTVQGSVDLTFPGSAVSHVGAASNTAPAAMGLPNLTGTGWEYHTFRLDASEGLPNKGFIRAKVSE